MAIAGNWARRLMRESTRRRWPMAAHTRLQRTFRQAFPEFRIRWIRDLRAAWRVRVGGRVSRVDIRPNADEGSVLVSLAPLGANGGTLSRGHGAVRYDTRDNYMEILSARHLCWLGAMALGVFGILHLPLAWCRWRAASDNLRSPLCGASPTKAGTSEINRPTHTSDHSPWMHP